MQPLPVVVLVDEWAAVAPQIIKIPILTTVDFFLLQRFQEAFASGVVIRVSGSAHAAGRTVLPQQLGVIMRRILGGFNRSSQRLHLEELQYGYTKTWSLSTRYPTSARIDRPPTGGFEGGTALFLAG